MKNKYWKWTLEEDMVIDLWHLGFQFEDLGCRWASIKGNILTIKKGYSWDGCSPKGRIFGMVIGTWDGPINPKTGRQWCYLASLVHDVLYQFRIGQKADADLIFLALLVGFGLSVIYYKAVRAFGPRKGWKS